MAKEYIVLSIYKKKKKERKKEKKKKQNSKNGQEKISQSCVQTKREFSSRRTLKKREREKRNSD